MVSHCHLAAYVPLFIHVLPAVNIVYMERVDHEKSMHLQLQAKGQGWGRLSNHQIGVECTRVIYLLLYVFDEYMSFSSNFEAEVSFRIDTRLTTLSNFEVFMNDDVDNQNTSAIPSSSQHNIDGVNAFDVEKYRSTDSFIAPTAKNHTNKSGSPIAYYSLYTIYQMYCNSKWPGAPHHQTTNDKYHHVIAHKARILLINKR